MQTMDSSRTDERIDDLSHKVDETNSLVGAVRTEMRDDFKAFRAEMKEDFRIFRAEMAEDSRAFRAEMAEDSRAFRAEMAQEFRAVRSEMATMTRTMLGATLSGLFAVLATLIAFHL